MKKSILFAAAAALLATVACNKEFNEKVVSAPEAVSDEIVFAVNSDMAVDVESKVVSEVSSLSSFNVNCVTGTLGSSETSKFNVSFSGNNTSGYKGATAQYWPSTDASYKFYASNIAITAAGTGAYVNATNTTDVVCAVLASPTYKQSNELTFNHIFARLGYCKISAPDGYTITNLKVTVTPKTGGKYTLNTGNGKTDGTGWSGVTTASTASSIATSLGSTTSNDIYLVPGSYTLTAEYTITKGAYSVTYSGATAKTASVNMVGGNINDLTATLPADQVTEIQFTISVTPWAHPTAQNVTFN